MTFGFILVGAILAGIFLGKFEFALVGALFGFVLARLQKLSGQIQQNNREHNRLVSRIAELESNRTNNSLAKSKTSQSNADSAAAKENQQQPATRITHASTASVDTAKIAQAESATPAISQADRKPDSKAGIDKKAPPWVAQPSPQAVGASSSQTAGNDNFVSQAINWLTNYFTQGNPVARVGAVILFFGVAFLLKYAAAQITVPIEVRLSAVAFGAIALLIFGWRLRIKNLQYGLILQGTAVGVLYLTIFAAFRIYATINAGFAFPLLIMISALAMTMAALQNSKTLAVLSASGGFLAPVLISTGTGSHVALFSYYTILNLGIFAVAWSKSWRILNLTGFIFTFVIGTTWGVLKYQPTHFATTEPFLILFYVLYVAIAVLFATRQRPALKEYVDGTLIFGLPIIAFGLQVAIVHRFEYGVAWSSFALGAFYLSVAYLLIRKQVENTLILGQAFIALGIIFTTLTIPFAVDGSWTSAAWAIEGAGLIWIGLRQQRRFLFWFGILIQFAGGMMFLVDALLWQSHLMVLLNSQFMGEAMLTSAGLFSAFQLYKHNQTQAPRLTKLANPLSLIFIIWGLCWWYFGGLDQVTHYFADENTAAALIVFSGVSALLWHFLAVRYQWHTLNHLIWINLVVVTFAGSIYLFENSHPFANWGMLIWLLVLSAHYFVLNQQDKLAPQTPAKKSEHPITFNHQGLHFLSFVGVFLLACMELHWQISEALGYQQTWFGAALAMMLCGFLWFCGLQNKWPVSLHQTAYANWGVKFITSLMLLWSLHYNFLGEADSAPIAYLPLLNPVDLAQAIILLTLVKVFTQPERATTFSTKQQITFAIGFGFIWVNAILLHTLHHWTGVAYNVYSLSTSTMVQTAVSILWTIIGLTGAVIGSKRSSRKIWIYSSVLLAVVVVKLFLVELENSASIERIVSFLVVGILFLGVGYFAPIPSQTNLSTDVDDKTLTNQRDNHHD